MTGKGGANAALDRPEYPALFARVSLLLGCPVPPADRVYIQHTTGGNMTHNQKNGRPHYHRRTAVERATDLIRDRIGAIDEERAKLAGALIHLKKAS